MLLGLLRGRKPLLRPLIGTDPRRPPARPTPTPPETARLSSQFAISPDPPRAAVGDRPARPRPPAPTPNAAPAALAPALAAAAALLLHRLPPSRQSPLPTHIYPTLLAALIGASLALAAAQWAWRPLRPWARRNAPLAAGAIGLLALWDLITLKLAWMPLPFFPGPDAVFRALLDDRAMLLDSAYHSLLLLLGGYAAGAAAGLVTGVAIGWFRRLRYWGMPLLKLLGPIPATAYVPLAMALFPDSFVSGCVLIALAVWFPVAMLTTSGIANVPVSYLDVARTLGAGRIYLIFRVAIPAALPNIFLGLFMGLGAAFLTLIVAETVGVQSGLGWYLKWQQGYVEYAKVYAALLIMAVFFSGLMTLLFRARDGVLVWQKGVLRW